jgi:UDP-N-acetylmuramate dehydrogenase
MNLLSNISLKKWNSFGCEVIAPHFVAVHSNIELEEALSWAHLNKQSVLILGGGSNILFTKSPEGLVIKMEQKGITLIKETSSEVYLRVCAGENWHHFVSFCVQKGWGGIENLSLIPGTVGAAPIQNIGAYGVEVKDVIKVIHAFDTTEQCWVELQAADCAFGYRDSIFKQQKNRYLITEIDFCLQKQPTLHTDYGAIREVLHQKQIKQPSLTDIANAVIQIRTHKLPNPSILGNAGSFFKNPTVSKNVYEALLKNHPQITAFPISDHAYKIAAGWLIESAGWKGKQIGQVGCYEHQALVIVNYGNANGEEIYHFSSLIIESVKEKFGLTLEREVNII